MRCDPHAGWRDGPDESSTHYNRRHTSSESGVSVLRPRQPHGRSTRVGSIRSIFRRSDAYLTFKFIADCLPSRLLSTSYSTICPSLSELRQARSTALICTNTSVPPPPLWLNETLALRWIEPLPGRGVAGEITGDFAVFDATTTRSSTGTMSAVHSSCESEFFGAHTGFTRPLVLPTADPDRHSSCTPSRFGRPPCNVHYGIFGPLLLTLDVSERFPDHSRPDPIER